MTDEIGPEIPEAFKRPAEESVAVLSKSENGLDDGPKRIRTEQEENEVAQINTPHVKSEDDKELAFTDLPSKPIKSISFLLVCFYTIIILALKFEETYLRSLPRATQYEKSFMHRDTVTHIFATKTDFIITASCDGHLKFWKKIHKEGVEFVKHFRCHMRMFSFYKAYINYNQDLDAFSDIAINYNGTLMATVCNQEKTVKIFDIVNFDMINMFKYPFSPKLATWVHIGSDVVHALAISDASSPKIFIYDGKGENVPIHMLENMHTRPVALMEVNCF